LAPWLALPPNSAVHLEMEGVKDSSGRRGHADAVRGARLNSLLEQSGRKAASPERWELDSHFSKPVQAPWVSDLSLCKQTVPVTPRCQRDVAERGWCRYALLWLLRGCRVARPD